MSSVEFGVRIPDFV